MLSPSENAVIENYKNVLKESLSRKYIDLSLYLGLITHLQSQFEKWITEDIAEYRSSCLQSAPGQVDPTRFKLTELLETLWTEFHHPIIKSFLRQHAELFSELVKSLKGPKKSFRPVEMRKLNEAFSKYVKLASRFYQDVLKHVADNYANLLIPQKYLKELKIVITSEKDLTKSMEFEANLLHVMYLCLLGLGNLTRHSAHLTSAYVEPGKSVAAYYQHLKEGSTTLLKKLYLVPLLYYSKCIGLFPTLNQPYNHIGVIYNSVDQKFSAALWFLRSQFTRHQQTRVGQYNMVTIFTKPWLDAAYREAIKKTPDSLQVADFHNILLRVLADYFYPQAYKQQLYRKKVESDLLERMFHNKSTVPSGAVLEQLTVMICFYALAETEKPQVCESFGSFVVDYITAYLKTVNGSRDEEKESVLKCVRLILAFGRRNSQFLLLMRSDFLSTLLNTVNRFINDDEELAHKAALAFAEARRPVRSHYFSEDVQYKDFSPIGFQFKDFDDDHLFQSGNVDLLFGSYYYTQEQDIPTFLDNLAVQRINKEVEFGNGKKEARDEAIRAECLKHENLLRLQAIIVLAKALFNEKIQYDEERLVFAEAKLMPAPRAKPKKKGKKEEKDTTDEQSDYTEVAKTMSSEIQSAEPAAVPSSLDEIELMIIGHVSNAERTQNDLSTEVGLADMVNSIVSDEQSESKQVLASVEIGTSSSQNSVSSAFVSPAGEKNEPAKPVQLLRPTARLQEIRSELQATLGPEVATAQVHPGLQEVHTQVQALQLSHGSVPQYPQYMGYPGGFPMTQPIQGQSTQAAPQFFAPGNGMMPQPFGGPYYGQFPGAPMPNQYMPQWGYAPWPESQGFMGSQGSQGSQSGGQNAGGAGYPQYQ